MLAYSRNLKEIRWENVDKIIGLRIPQKAGKFLTT